MKTQSDFIADVRIATEHIFNHRANLRRVAVRIGFWPEGLIISAQLSGARSDEEIAASTQEVVPWEKVETIDLDGLKAVVDRVCQPAYDLRAKYKAARDANPDKE